MLSCEHLNRCLVIDDHQPNSYCPSVPRSPKKCSALLRTKAEMPNGNARYSKREAQHDVGTDCPVWCKIIISGTPLYTSLGEINKHSEGNSRLSRKALLAEAVLDIIPIQTYLSFLGVLIEAWLIAKGYGRPRIRRPLFVPHIPSSCPIFCGVSAHRQHGTHVSSNSGWPNSGYAGARTPQFWSEH